jgi:hypothetical protein
MNKRIGLATQQWTLCVLVLMLGVGLTGCKSTPPAPETAPAGPEITVGPGETIAIHASAKRADGFEWTLSGVGDISGTEGPAILYTAPDEAGMAILSVTAGNARGTSPSTSLTINVAAAATYSLDALSIPAGWMSGASAPAAFISLESGTDCPTGARCSRFTYSPGGSWGGVYWWSLECGDSGTGEAWDRVRAGTCGINVLEACGLSAVHRLTFWARGERGGEIVEFKIGGTDVSPKPGRSTGKKSLEPDWKQYEIDLEGLDLTNAVGLFLWIATDIDNPEGATFYLDGLQFEGMK